MSSQMEKLSGWCHSLCRISSIAQAQRASQIISCPHQKLLPWCQWRPQSKPEIWVSVPFHTFACKHHKHGLGLFLVWQSEEILSSSEHQSALHFIYKLLSLNVFSLFYWLIFSYKPLLGVVSSNCCSCMSKNHNQYDFIHHCILQLFGPKQN